MKVIDTRGASAERFEIQDILILQKGENKKKVLVIDYSLFSSNHLGFLDLNELYLHKKATNSHLVKEFGELEGFHIVEVIKAREVALVIGED